MHLKMAIFNRANVIPCSLLNNTYYKFTPCITGFKEQKRRLAAYNDNNPWIPQGKRTDKGDVSTTYVMFEDMLNFRRRQAYKSILVQVQSPKSHDELFHYCTEFGDILSMHHYKTVQNQHFILIEYMNTLAVNKVLKHGSFTEENQVAPAGASTLWFRTGKNPIKLSKYKAMGLSVTNGVYTHSDQEIFKLMQSSKNASEQMMNLYNALKLDDLETRLRFYTACQLEQCLSGLFPDIIIQPFGSSVNGFGKRRCDLDLVLYVEKSKKKNSSRLIFHAKPLLVFQRNEQKELLVTLANTLDYFFPGIRNVRKIVEARVPIIKFSHDYTNIECDLSTSNTAAMYMSELLYMFGELDPRVKPLVFTIRKWAWQHRITCSHPGRWISNFSLTLLAIFYLQQKQILPSVKLLKSYATHSDIRLTHDLVDCTFLHDLSKLPTKHRLSDNHQSLEALLHGFFEFYCKFDFNTQAISIRDGVPVKKADNSPLYICNPLEPSLNVSKNVSTQELERIKVTSRDALFILETFEGTSSWGLIPLFGLKDAGPKTINVSQLIETPEVSKDSRDFDSTIIAEKEKGEIKQQ